MCAESGVPKQSLELVTSLQTGALIGLCRQSLKALPAHQWLPVHATPREPLQVHFALPDEISLLGRPCLAGESAGVSHHASMHTALPPNPACVPCISLLFSYSLVAARTRRPSKYCSRDSAKTVPLLALYNQVPSTSGIARPDS